MPNNLKKINKIKFKAFELKKNYQIPNELYLKIISCKYGDTKYVQKLMNLCKELLRVKGYYKDLTEIQEITIHNLIEKSLKD